MADTYQYSEKFQTKVIGLMLRDSTFLSEYRDVIRTEYFEFDSHQILCGLLLEYFDKYNTRPTSVVLGELIREYAKEVELGKSDKREVLTVARDALKKPLDDIDYVRDAVVKFGQRQALRQGILGVLDLLDNDDDLEKARTIIEEALQTGHKMDLGLDLFNELDRVKQILADEANDHSPKHKVKTLLRSLDKHLKGGLGIGELGVVMGSPGQGKSIVLCHMGVAALATGKKVAHFTLGDLSETDVAIRYLSRLTGSSTDNLLTEDFSVFEKKLRKLLADPRFIVKYLVPGRHTVQTIRSHLSRLAAMKGWRPDLVIVDYADKLIDSRGMNRNSRQFRGDENLGNIYDDLIALGRDEKHATWTASQIKVEYFQADVVNIDAASGAWLKMANADVVMPICQTPQEAQKDRARLFGGKVRRGKDQWMIHIEFEKDRMLIREVDPPVKKERDNRDKERERSKKRNKRRYED